MIAYPSPDGTLNEVVHGVSLTVARGEVMGLVGESGSGKSQTAFATLGVLPNEAVVVRGSILFDGVELIGLSDAQMRPLRVRQSPTSLRSRCRISTPRSPSVRSSSKAPARHSRI